MVKDNNSGWYVLNGLVQEFGLLTQDPSIHLKGAFNYGQDASPAHSARDEAQYPPGHIKGLFFEQPKTGIFYNLQYPSSDLVMLFEQTLRVLS